MTLSNGIQITRVMWLSLASVSPLFYHILLILVVFPFAGIAQEKTDAVKTLIIEQRIEMIAEELEEEEIDFTTLFDELSYYYDHPLNLNTAKKEEMEQLDLLNDIQINHLLEHLEKNGKLISIYELQSVDGFDPETINLILPFVKVTAMLDSPHISIKEMLKDGKNEVFIRYIRILEGQEGFKPIDDSTLAASPNKRYLGSPDRLYLRYRFKFSNKISWGFTAEKDAGEELFSGTQSGFDYYSAHLYLRDIGKIKHLVIGDYHVQLGQGLTLWSGLGFGKSSDIMNVKKNPLTIRPYTSVDENVFMRGAVATVGIKNFEVTGFYSNKKIDANISASDTLGDEEEIIVTSFQTSGYHRTPGELVDKDAIRETMFGGHLAYNTRKLNVGATAVRSEWGGGLQRALYPYNQFEFNDSHNLNLGVDYNYIFRNFNLFGEVSRSENGGMAYLSGALVSLDPRLALSVVHRNYQRDYQALYSEALSESSKNANEKGTYFGMVAKPLKYITVNAYFDKFRFPWLKYQVDAPSDGIDFLVQTNYKPSKKLEMYLRYKQEIKGKNTKEDAAGIDYPVKTDKQNLRFNISWKMSDALRLRSRMEIVNYLYGAQEPESGYLVYQDVMYKPMSSPFAFTFRFALFDTDSYDSRIYAYENDVLYYFYIPAYYYRGSRTQLTLRYRILRGIDVWLRFAQTFYANRNVISSGLNEIEGNTKSEIKAQLRFRF